MQISSLFLGTNHSNGNVVILIKFSLIAALLVVKITTSSTASGEKKLFQNDDIFISVIDQLQSS